MTKPGV